MRRIRELAISALLLAPLANPLANTIGTLDTGLEASISATSIALGADGLPVISYTYRTEYPIPLSWTLRVAKCADAACTSATISTIDHVNWPSSSIAIGADGLPVIAYSGNDGHLRTAKCADPACIGPATITSISDAGLNASVALGADGLPVIAFIFDGLKVAKCADAACASTTIAAVDDSAWPDSTSITVGADGAPVIGYSEDFTVDPHNPGPWDFKVAKCANAACTGSATITTLDRTTSAGHWNSITVGADGLPVISYSSYYARILVAKCMNAACTATTITPLTSSGRNSSITLGASGLPVISFFDVTDANLMVATCADAACASATLALVGALGGLGSGTSIALGADGLPVISYLLVTNSLTSRGDLRVAKCSSSTCLSPATSPQSADVSIAQTVFHPAFSDQDMIVTLTATNSGPATATNVVWTYPVPAGTSFIWATLVAAVPGCTQASGTVTCTLASLAAGASAWVQVVIRPGSVPSFTSAASVAAAESDPSISNNMDSATYPVTASPTGVPVLRYRLYSPVTLEHHFTTDLNEYNTLGSYVGTWVQEGTVGHVLDNPGSFNGVTATPYYRLYDTSISRHHWTTDPNEYYTLIQFPQFNAEGVDGYLLPTQAAGTIPLYRLLYPFPIGGGALHHWTVDPVEYSILISSYGWIGEGGTGFVIQ